MPLLLLAQVAVTWGEASDGVAVGVGRTRQELQVHFRNTARPRGVHPGREWHGQRRYDRPERSWSRVPRAEVSAGAVDRGRDWTLDQLFARGYSVHVSLTATPEGNSWARLPTGDWTGTIRSGEIP